MILSNRIELQILKQRTLGIFISFSNKNTEIVIINQSLMLIEKQSTLTDLLAIIPAVEHNITWS